MKTKINDYTRNEKGVIVLIFDLDNNDTLNHNTCTIKELYLLDCRYNSISYNYNTKKVELTNTKENDYFNEMRKHA